MCDDDLGDFCIADIMFDGVRYKIVTVYFNPGISVTSLIQFFLKFHHIFTHLPTDLRFILCGDFNLNMMNESNQQKLLAFMETTYGFKLANDLAQSTTISQTCLDLIFTRNVTILDCLPHITYFSHHKAIFAVLD